MFASVILLSVISIINSLCIPIKINLTPYKEELTVEQTMKAQRWSRSIALPFFNLDIRGVGGQCQAQLIYSR